MKKTSYILLALITLASFNAQAQEAPTIKDRVVTTAVPFLLISGDARASGMGDQGVATAVDAYAQQWNPAKFVFAEKQQGVGFSYVPYLRELVADINLGVLSYYNRFNERSAVAASLRYFGQGEIQLRDTPDQQPRVVEPNEVALDLTYSLRLGEQISMAVTGRYIRSDLKIEGLDGDANAANTFGVDISSFYQSEEIPYRDFNGRWRAGVNISNIGPKLKYDDAGQENFIPTNFKAGAGFDFIFDAANKIGVYGEVNKLLVPTPSDSNGDLRIDREDDWYNESSFGAIFSSWGDAPDGFSEELKEFTWSLGAEYWYEDSFAFRVGYFNESEVKGFRKFLSLGAGFRYSVAQIDVSYLFSTSKAVANPLEGTLRFSLSFNLGKEYYEY
ncbi:type IX secretion system outer membrane channel protein PorV [Mesonia sp. HuA40]|uniref:type IX secretion system outer membrane channel protein PorV n=1 Tax=Mesonia sp. HuA40 TaxID=2602761 RepID=UPI0011C9399A|nr:type IX secretion system outer membrane channel protein PorV [Mesonia sp. HuA40]TXK73419.1 type IX secretion system outer membrane channel protein PorV [Mesonia sp. HuA40]